MFIQPGKTVFICKVLIEVQVLVRGLTGSKIDSRSLQRQFALRLSASTPIFMNNLFANLPLLSIYFYATYIHITPPPYTYFILSLLSIVFMKKVKNYLIQNTAFHDDFTFFTLVLILSLCIASFVYLPLQFFDIH